MAISMYNASVPVFKQMLNSLSTILTKTEMHVVEKKIDPDVILQARLFPDMFHFTRQVQIATDFAKGVSARLAGMAVPVYEDDESSFNELQERIAKTVLFITDIAPAAIEGSEERDIVTQAGTPKEKQFKGQPYLLHYALPHFFFHVTTAYDILRSNGIAVGKRDYMGTF